MIDLETDGRKIRWDIARFILPACFTSLSSPLLNILYCTYVRANTCSWNFIIISKLIFNQMASQPPCTSIDTSQGPLGEGSPCLRTTDLDQSGLGTRVWLPSHVLWKRAQSGRLVTAERAWWDRLLGDTFNQHKRCDRSVQKVCHYKENAFSREKHVLWSCDEWTVIKVVWWASTYKWKNNRP